MKKLYNTQTQIATNLNIFLLLCFLVCGCIFETQENTRKSAIKKYVPKIALDKMIEK